ncbi:hypothetical protein [Xanthomonas sp. 1678]|uniref:hypothetical protein n=1 Tax=Xanthomonas sp. 1678 TaxID=3158788 RepID=UPI0028620A3B|nr:hypothetical protein [Xanthomonas translucens]
MQLQEGQSLAGTVALQEREDLALRIFTESAIFEQVNERGTVCITPSPHRPKPLA